MKSFFNKKTYLFIGALVALLLITPDVTHAQGVTDLLKFVDPTYYIGKLFELIVLPLAAGAMAFTGMILDYAVRFSLGTAYIFGNLTVINQSWVVIRDICNLFFIFTLIWISIQTIVNLSNFDTKRRLTQLIIAALIINFSLYFTKVFVDVSNIFGNWLYGGILASLKANGASTSISALIASKLEIFRLWEDPAGNAALLAKTLNDSGIITPVLKLIVVLVATYVFMYTAILFMTRAVTIIFLLVLSPIGFIGGLLPQIEEYSKKWWGELVDAVTFPIVYLLMLYISLQLINNMEASSVWASFFSGNPAVVAGIDTGKVFKYIIVICALLICLKVAKDSAGQLGKAASGIASGASNFMTRVGSSGIALTAFGGRRFIGSRAANMTQNENLQNMAAGKVGSNAFSRSVNQIRGKASLAVARKGAESSFDIRGAAPFASIAKTVGVDVGKPGGKGGFSQMTKDQEKADKEYAAKFGDDKDGLDKQMAYAESRRSSIFNWIAIGKKAQQKNADKLRTEAGNLYTKAQKTDAQKEAQGITNLMVDANIPVNNLEKAAMAADHNGVNQNFDEASRGLENFMVQRERTVRKDKIKIISQAKAFRELHQKLISQNDIAQANALKASEKYLYVMNLEKEATGDEIEEADKIGSLIEADLDKAITNYEDKFIQTRNQTQALQQSLKIAKTMGDLSEKKTAGNAVANIIKNKIIGKEGSGKQKKDPAGNPIVDKNGEPEMEWGTGLAGELKKSRSKATKKKNDAWATGADEGGAPGPKKADAEDGEDKES